MQSLDYASTGSGVELRQALDDFGTTYMRGVGTDQQLLQLAESLGEVTEPGVAMPNKAHDGRIYSVHVRNAGKGVVDQHGNVIVSTTNREFSLHTDAYNRATPPRYVLLLRVDDGSDNTLSFVSDAWRALEALPSPVSTTLAQAIFPSAFGPTPVLHLTVGAPPAIRFNDEEIVRWAGQGENPLVSSQASCAIAEFKCLLRTYQETLTIEPADCLVLDNWRVCHGRSAMAPGSTRELKRVWVA